jgi:predicted nucleic acid-binding protein
MNVKQLKGRVLVDTNVLIYATLSADGRCARAQEVLALRNSPNVELCVSVQNLAEMYPNLTGPKNSQPDTPELARRKIESIAGLSALNVLPMSLTISRRALQLCERYSVTRQRYFDMQLVATMLEEGIATILTENSKDFEGIEEISVVNPFL